MKTISTLLFSFIIGFSIYAQDFPDPYCDIDDEETTTEEITLIEFAETEITNTDSTEILIDQTASEADLSPGETYTLTVKGDTKGEFDNDIVAFIDWNQNDALDDEGEVYEVGTLTDSDGQDDVSVSTDITVPEDAENGATRIRITKTYTDEESVAEINPCAIEMDAFGMGAYPGFGQAIDFTLNINDLGTNSFDTDQLTLSPNPTTDYLNIAYESTIKTINIYSLSGQKIYSQDIEQSKEQIDVSQFNNDVYLIELITENGQHTTKFIKK